MTFGRWLTVLDDFRNWTGLVVRIFTLSGFTASAARLTN